MGVSSKVMELLVLKLEVLLLRARWALELRRNALRAWWTGAGRPMRAEDVPPPSSSAWWSWRWWLHLLAGGRAGTYCSSSRCRPCRVWRELGAGRGWPPLPRPLPTPPALPRALALCARCGEDATGELLAHFDCELRA